MVEDAVAAGEVTRALAMPEEVQKSSRKLFLLSYDMNGPRHERMFDKVNHGLQSSHSMNCEPLNSTVKCCSSPSRL